MVNFPPEALAERIWAMPSSHGAERITRSGLSLLRARAVTPPLIAECKAHLECKLESVTWLGDELVIFGHIVAASIDQDCLGSPPAAAGVLPGRGCVRLDRCRQTGGSCLAHRPGADGRGVLRSPRQPGCGRARGLPALAAGSGVLPMAGPYDGGPAKVNAARPSGMVILAVTEAEAVQIAEADPLVRGGARYVVRRWTRTF